MTHLERVRKALNHEEPDRVPIDFGGWLCGIKSGAYDRLADYLGFGQGERDGYDPPESMLLHFDIDLRRVSPSGPPERKNPDGTKTDEWGITRKMANNDEQIVEFPLKDSALEDLEKYSWPEDSGEGRYEGLAEEAAEYHNKGFAVVGQPDIDGLFETQCWLTGFERALTDIALKSDFYYALSEKITSLQEKFAENYYSRVGDNIDMTQLGDDLSTQTGPFFPMEMYMEMIFPYQKRYHEAINRHTSAKIFHHCCGSVYGLIPGLIECGVQVLNPVQTSATDMEPEKLKKEFGNDLAFHGGIDVQKVLPFKKPEEVKDEVKRVIDALAPGGGFILAPSHNIQDDVPPEYCCHVRDRAFVRQVLVCFIDNGNTACFKSVRRRLYGNFSCFLPALYYK